MVKIFVMTHKAFDVPNDEMYIPLHVGRAGAERDLGYAGDDTGDNISALNCYYAELSGIYWVWKNFRAAGYVGICHYRRFLTDEKGLAFTQKEYESILQKYDIVTTKQLELPNSYRYGFSAHHGKKALYETGNVIKERHPEFYDAYVTLLDGNKTYFGNMLVAKKEVYDEYCEWLFDILFALEARIDLNFADDYHRRIFGFISEFLLYVWVKAKKLSAYECRVAIIGEKNETKEVKAQMRLFFKKRDVEGAKEYLRQYLQKRPDIIMEASDITGECKLCLQAVSTANLELCEYGKCFLDSINDYDEVISYFRQLNKAASESLNSQGDNYAHTIKAQNYDISIIGNASDIALRAAIHLYAPDSKAAQAAFERLRRLGYKQGI